MKLFDYLRTGKTYILAEMSANHGGSLEKALEIVRAAAETGADYLKIQTYTADTLTLDCDNEYFKLTSGLWKGYTRYNLYQEAYTPWEWHEPIKKLCEELGMDFLSTAFDSTSVDFLEDLGVEAYKIASFELVDIPLIRLVASKGKPMIISCGMGTEEEIREAVDTVRGAGNENFVLLKCTSEYPAVPVDMRLSLIPKMAEDFRCPVGLSDHSLGYDADLIAVALGARVIEKHFCISCKDTSPDAAFSTTKEEFTTLVEKIRLAESMLGTQVYQLTETEQKGRMNRRSLFVTEDIEKGHLLTRDNVRSIRPGHGLHTRYYDEVLGKTAQKDLKRGEPLKEDDFQ